MLSKSFNFFKNIFKIKLNKSFALFKALAKIIIYFN